MANFNTQNRVRLSQEPSWTPTTLDRDAVSDIKPLSMGGVGGGEGFGVQKCARRCKNGVTKNALMVFMGDTNARNVGNALIDSAPDPCQNAPIST